MSGKASVSDRCCRDCSTTWSRWQKARARKPSNFGSYTQPGPVGSRVTFAAAIGATGAATGRGAVGVSGVPVRDGFGLPTCAR